MTPLHASFERLLLCAKAATARLPAEQRIENEQDLKRVLGWSHQRLTNMKRRGVSKEGALEAESVFSCPAAYVRDGTHAPHWMNAQHSVAREKAAPYAVAHVVSHPAFENVPLLHREQLLKDRPPETFRFAMPDEAMAPEFPAGTEIVWTTRRRIAPGRLLLLVDAHDQLHVRRCQQSDSPGSWVAGPQNAAYRTFRHDEHGVQVLAVYKGRLEPDDD
jgi:hypothetical protein